MFVPKNYLQHIIIFTIVVALIKMTEAIVKEIISLKPDKCIALDKLFAGNDQLKTNTVLQMRDAGVEFKTI